MRLLKCFELTFDPVPGHLPIRTRVVLSSQRIQVFIQFQKCGAFGRPLEMHMFDEMRETGGFFGFIPRSDLDQHNGGHCRSGRRNEQDRQTIREGETITDVHSNNAKAQIPNFKSSSKLRLK